MMNLKGMTVIVTGAGRGIGRAIALELAGHGANVVCTARRELDLAETVSLIEAAGGSALAVATDITQPQQVENMVNTAIGKFGQVDVLFNNAGSFMSLGAVWETDIDQWVQDINVNLIGTYLCSRAVLPHMIDRDSGIIITMRGGCMIPGGTGYSCSKVAIPRFTELLAKELEREGSNVICFSMGPGFVHTEMTDYQITEPMGQKWLPSSKEAVEQGQDRPPEDCAVTTAQLIAIACPQMNGGEYSAGEDITALQESFGT